MEKYNITGSYNYSGNTYDLNGEINIKKINGEIKKENRKNILSFVEISTNIELVDLFYGLEKENRQTDDLEGEYIGKVFSLPIGTNTILNETNRSLISVFYEFTREMLGDNVKIKIKKI